MSAFHLTRAGRQTLGPITGVVHRVLESLHMVDQLSQTVVACAPTLDTQLAQRGNRLAAVHQVEPLPYPDLTRILSIAESLSSFVQMRLHVRSVEDIARSGKLVGQRLTQSVATIADADDLGSARQTSADSCAEELICHLRIRAQAGHSSALDFFGLSHQSHAYITPFLLTASTLLSAYGRALPTR